MTASTSTSTSVKTGTRPNSDRYYELGEMTMKQLERVFLRGHTPELDSLAGWEYRGMNTPKWAKLAGIKKFIKGMVRRDGAVYGYNTPVVQNSVNEPWIAKPSEDRPKRFGFYRTDRVDPTARDNEYLHSVLLDYGRGGNGRFDPTRGLRDYLVQVEADDPDLFLGKAYYRIGPVCAPTSFFVLQRHRETATE